MRCSKAKKLQNEVKWGVLQITVLFILHNAVHRIVLQNAVQPDFAKCGYHLRKTPGRLCISGCLPFIFRHVFVR